MNWLTLWNICVTNDHGYIPLVINTPRSFPHSQLITGFLTRLTRRVPLPEHLRSPRFIVGFVLLDLWFYMYVFRWLFVLLHFFIWPLCCLFFFDIRILIAPLISSKFEVQTLFIIIYVNVYVKRVYPHKTNNNILFRY